MITLENSIRVTHERHRDRSRELQRNTPREYLGQNFQDYLPKYSNPKKYFIFDCHCDRQCFALADKQNGIITAYFISLLTNRTIGIIHTCPVDLEEALMPNKIKWNIDQSKLKGLSVSKVDTTHDKKFIAEIPKTDFNQLFTADVVYFLGNTDTVRFFRRHGDIKQFIPWLGKTTDGEAYSKLLHLMFKPSPYLEREISMFYKKLENKPLVCAHLKLKGTAIPERMSIQNLLKNKFSLPDTNAVIHHLKNIRNIGGSKLVVISDSNEVRSRLRRAFPQQMVETSSLAGHMDETENRLEVDLFFKTVFEQYILTSCDTLLLSLSRFGLNGAYIRGTSKNLYCLHKHSVIPCSMETVNPIYGWL